ncbi:MAG: UDP-glucose 4-epimerase [Thermoleophilaceae bacterium]|nr:UDP-glucose 4-epimerase [Thermoleophilaceae bacterium]
MKVLVTGGAGFIGSHVVDKTLARGHSVRVFDLIPSAYHDADEVESFSGDLTDVDALATAMHECDAVVHLAAVADVAHVAADPAYAEKVNAGGTFNVLEAARRAGVGRVVYASTIWVYNGLQGIVDEDTPLGLPAHFYTATKLAGEMYCTSYAELYGIDFTILRFGIPYGPRARPAAVVPAFVRNALAGKPLTIAGAGEQSRRFVYVEDLAEGTARAIEPGAANRVYNLVGEEDTTVRQIAEVVRDLIGDVEIVHTERRAGDFTGAEVSGARAEAELGWRATTPFAEGVRLYLEWLREEQAQRALDAEPA